MTKKIKVDFSAPIMDFSGEALKRGEKDVLTLAHVVHYVFTVVPCTKENALERFRLAKKIETKEVELTPSEIVMINETLDKCIDIERISLIEAGNLKEALGV